jgi:Zn-dependent peptidase ImmA (M78 family)
MRRKLIEKKTPPEWNVRVMTEADFWSHADAAGIVVSEMQLEQPGYSIYCDGSPHIFIQDQLRGVDRLYTLWHEIAHYWLHKARIQFFLGLNQDIEFEANLVAACALIPQTMLTHYWPNEIAQEYGYPDWLIKYRQVIFEYWDI